MAVGKHKEFDWGDPALQEETTREVSNYKCKKDGSDYLRIVHEHIIKVPCLDFNPGGKFARVRLPPEGRRSKGLMRMIAKVGRYEIKYRYATVILYIARKPRGSKKPQLLGKVLIWMMDDEKKSELWEINESTGGKLMNRDLVVKVREGNDRNEQYQKVRIIVLEKSKSLFDRFKKSVRKELLLLVKEKMPVLLKEIKPSSQDAEGRIKSILDAMVDDDSEDVTNVDDDIKVDDPGDEEEDDEEDDEEEDDEEDEEEEDEEEDDDEEEDEEEDDDDEDEDDEEEEKVKPKRKKKKSKKSKKAKSKKG